MANKIFWICLSWALLQCAVIDAQPPADQKYITQKTASEKLQKIYKKGIQYSRANQNVKALKEFNKILNQEPKFIDAQIQWAAIHYDMKNYESAEKGFEKVLKIDPMYKKKVLYTLGLTEMKLKKFDEAAEHFEKYISSEPNNEILIKKAEQHLQSSKFMKVAFSNEVPFVPESLGENVNTKFAEYLPALTADGESLIYTANIGGQEDFLMSRKIDGVWQKGIPLTTINTPLNEGAQSISADGKFLVFTGCNRKDGYGSCDLYYSEVRDGRWTPPANIGPPINTRGWESQPSISADKRTLFFSSAKKGGIGGKDIWVSYRQSDGKWGEPVNLGEPINSVADEQSPFIHADGKTLYFMSDGHPGMGSHDFFYSRKNENDIWEAPVNLGYPINTKASEGGLIVSLDGATAYFASDRGFEKEGESLFDSGSGGGQTDLYSFELYAEARPQPVTYVRATVIDADTKKKLSAKVEFVDLKTGNVHSSSFTDLDGEFLVTLPMGKDYALNVSKEKYLFHSENFALAETASLDNPFLLKIELQSIKGEAASDDLKAISPPIVLRNVLFETGSAELKSESIFELNSLQQMLIDNPTLKIQINGHTDNVGSDEDNLKLSENRAKAVHDYLIKNGIAANRLQYKGFGEKMPIESNDTEWGRQNNRRTEFVMLGK